MTGLVKNRVGVRTGSGTGPPQGKRAPWVGISSTVFGVRGVRADIFRGNPVPGPHSGGVQVAEEVLEATLAAVSAM